LAGREARCWGDDTFGQLGHGQTVTGKPYAMPVLQPNGAPYGGVTELRLGSTFSCALREGGGVDCWGDNALAQLGNGDLGFPFEGVPYPFPVITADGSPLAGVQQLSVGSAHSCALLADGFVNCWGYNLDAQLGDGNPGTSPLHAAPLLAGPGTPLAGVARLALGYHSCALLADGHVKCWGPNDFGQMGLGTVGDELTLFPTTVPGLPPR
jgi:alpha-tubulin suppressor-like RCC1 family protein